MRTTPGGTDRMKPGRWPVGYARAGEAAGRYVMLQNDKPDDDHHAAWVLYLSHPLHPGHSPEISGWGESAQVNLDTLVEEWAVEWCPPELNARAESEIFGLLEAWQLAARPAVPRKGWLRALAVRVWMTPALGTDLDLLRDRLDVLEARQLDAVQDLPPMHSVQHKQFRNQSRERRRSAKVQDEAIARLISWLEQFGYGLAVVPLAGQVSWTPTMVNPWAQFAEDASSPD